MGAEALAAEGLGHGDGDDNGNMGGRARVRVSMALIPCWNEFLIYSNRPKAKYTSYVCI